MFAWFTIVVCMNSFWLGHWMFGTFVSWHFRNKQLTSAIFHSCSCKLVASGSNSEQRYMLLNTRDIWLTSRVGSVSVSWFIFVDWQLVPCFYLKLPGQDLQILPYMFHYNRCLRCYCQNLIGQAPPTTYQTFVCPRQSVIGLCIRAYFHDFTGFPTPGVPFLSEYIFSFITRVKKKTLFTF